MGVEAGMTNPFPKCSDVHAGDTAETQEIIEYLAGIMHTTRLMISYWKKDKGVYEIPVPYNTTKQQEQEVADLLIDRGWALNGFEKITGGKGNRWIILPMVNSRG